MKITRCSGNGLGSCTGCDNKGHWNRVWNTLLFEVEGYPGRYCSNCLREILDTNVSRETLDRKLLKDYE